VNENFRDSGIRRKYGILHFVRNPMTRGDGNPSIHANVEVYIVAESHLPHKAFVESSNAVNGHSDVTHRFFYAYRRRRIEQFAHWRPNLPNSVEENDWRGTESCPIVCRGVPCEEPYADADKSKSGCDCITEMMPGVGLHSITLDAFADSADVSGEHDLDHHHSEQYA